MDSLFDLAPYTKPRHRPMRFRVRKMTPHEYQKWIISDWVWGALNMPSLAKRLRDCQTAKEYREWSKGLMQWLSKNDTEAIFYREKIEELIENWPPVQLSLFD